MLHFVCVKYKKNTLCPIEAERTDSTVAVSWPQARAHIYAHLAADFTALVKAIAPIFTHTIAENGQSSSLFTL